MKLFLTQKEVHGVLVDENIPQSLLYITILHIFMYILYNQGLLEFLLNYLYGKSLFPKRAALTERVIESALESALVPAAKKD